MYEVGPAIPYVLATVLLATLAVFVFVHPGVAVRTEEPAELATVE